MPVHFEYVHCDDKLERVHAFKLLAERLEHERRVRVVKEKQG